MIQHDKFNEIVYFALETFQAAHLYHPTIVESYLNNFLSHPCFKNKSIPNKIYQEALASTKEYEQADINYHNNFNHFKRTLVKVLNSYFDCSFEYKGKLFFPDYEPLDSDFTTETSILEEKELVRPKQKLTFISRNILLIICLIGLGLIVGAMATIAGVMIAKGAEFGQGVLILIVLFSLCFIGAIITVYFTD